MIIAVYLLCGLTGFCFIGLLDRRERSVDPLLHLFLSPGIGLGLFAHLSFLALVVKDRFVPALVVGLSVPLAVGLLTAWGWSWRTARRPACAIERLERKDLWLAPVLSLIAWPAWIQAALYPLGGWDAWSSWNLKAKFIFLGQEHWKNLFDPALWRSSPHYPLLLPMMNAWGWSFTGKVASGIPMITAFVFTIATAGLLYASIRTLTQRITGLAAVLLIWTVPLFLLLSTSQYSDIVLAYFLLGGFCCLLNGVRKNSTALMALAGLCGGFLSFTKTEGLAAAVLLALLGLWHTHHHRVSFPDKINLLKWFLGGLVLGGVPMAIFHLVYTPPNITFINGFNSATDPTSWYRLKISLMFFFAELVSSKWNWGMMLLLWGLALNARRAFQKGLLIFPVFFLAYLAILFGYYLTNTYFEIVWWLQVTLHRVLFALLPTAALWVWLSFEPRGKSS